MPTNRFFLSWKTSHTQTHTHKMQNNKKKEPEWWKFNKKMKKKILNRYKWENICIKKISTIFYTQEMKKKPLN